MKRFLLFFLASFAALSAMAGDGTARGKAIDFDWDNGNKQAAGTKWYKVSLTDFATDPTNSDLVLFVGNLAPNTNEVTMKAYLGTSTSPAADEVRTFAINENKEIKLQRALLKSMGYPQVILCLTTSDSLKISATAVEPNYDTGCMSAEAVQYNWSTGIIVAPGNKYCNVSLEGQPADKDLKVKLTNLGTSKATVYGGVALSCPASGYQSITRQIEPGATVSTTIGNNSVWGVGVENIYTLINTDKKVKLELEWVEEEPYVTDHACESAEAFKYGQTYTIPANTDVWYKLDLDSIRESIGLSPVLTIINSNATKVTIDGYLSFECPVEHAPEHKTLSIAGGEAYTKLVERSLVPPAPINEAWVKLHATKEVTFNVVLTAEQLGDACLIATDFNWKDGHLQAAKKDQWYKIVPEKDSINKGLRIHVENLATTSNKVEAIMVSECPYSNTTSNTKTLAAGQTMTKDIPYSSWSGIDSLWVNLKNEGNLKFWATYYDDTIDTIKACLTAADFEYETLYSETGDSTWFRVPLDTIRNRKLSNLVPQITINGVGGQANIKGEVAWTCPITTTMASRTVSAPVSGMEKVVDLISSVNDTIEYAYLLVTADRAYTFRVDFVNPNEGKTCRDAVDFDWINCNTQDANDTVWYKIDMTDAIHNQDSLVIAIQNLGSTDGNVIANIYFDCDGQVVANYSYNISAGATREKGLGGILRGFDLKAAYVQLITTTDIKFCARWEDWDPTPDPACASANEVITNQDYGQAAGDRWYFLDLWTFRSTTNTETKKVFGDATLQITNEGTTTNEVTCELAWNCADGAIMTRNVTLNPAQMHESLLAAGLIDSTSIDTLYFHFVNNDTIKFRINQVDNRGEQCANPIPFDWNNCNTHVGPLRWYRAALQDTLNAHPDKDVLLTVTNLVNRTNAAAVKTYVDCDATTPYGEQDYSFEPLQEKGHVFHADLFTGSGMDILLSLESDDSLKICVTLVDKEDILPDTVYINDTVCAGINYPFEGSYAWERTDDTLFWSQDTLLTVQQRLLADSVLTINADTAFTHEFSYMFDQFQENTRVIIYNVYTRKAPVLPTAATLAAYIDPVAGLPLDITDLETALISEILGAETALSDSIDPSTITWLANPVVVPVADSLQLTYSIQTQICSKTYTDSLKFAITPGTIDSVVVATVCYGDSLEVNNKKYGVSGNFLDTLKYTNFDADSIRFDITLTVMPQAVKDTTVQVWCAGTPFEWNGTLYDSSIEDDFIEQYATVACDSAMHHLVLTVLEAQDSVVNATICQGDSIEVNNKVYKVAGNFKDTIKYAAYDCDSIRFDITLTVNSHSAATVYDTICYNGTYRAANYTTDQVFIDTTTNAVGCDSVITTYLHVMPQMTTDRTVEYVCYGETYTWSLNNQDYSTSGEYTYVEQFKNFACDSIEHHLILTVLDEARDSVVNRTICQGDSVEINGIFYKTALSNYKDVILYTRNTDCDSVSLTINITVNMPTAATVYDTVCYNTIYRAENRIADAVFIDTTTNAVGCDSVITTYLHVMPQTEQVYIDTTICAQEVFTLLGKDYNVEGLYYDTVHFSNFADCDSATYTLNLHIFTLPTASTLAYMSGVPQPTVAAELPFNDNGTVATLMNKYAAEQQANIYQAEVTELWWEIQHGDGSFSKIENGDIVRTLEGERNLRYAIKTACGDTIIATDFLQIGFEMPAVTVDTTVCVNMEHTFIDNTYLITGPTTVKDTLYTYPIDAVGDYSMTIYTYNVSVFADPQLTPLQLADVPVVVCGNPVDLTSTIKTIENYYVGGVDNYVDSIGLQINKGNGWEAIEDLANAPTTGFDLRYVARTYCGVLLYSNEVHVEAATPSSDNLDTLIVPSVSKYNAWLLMINVNAVKAAGHDISENDVTWYMVVGEVDKVDDVLNGRGDDQVVGHGYYYTADRSLNGTGDYYAIIDAAAAPTDSCGAEIRTVVYSYSTSNAPIRLRKTVLTTGESAEVLNLGGEEAQISILTADGKTIQALRTSEQENFFLPAITVPGYYMVRVQTASQNETMKFMVK